MSAKEISLLESILINSENSSKISALLAMVPDLSKQSLKKLLKMIHVNLFTTNDYKIQLQCIRILKYFMLLQNPWILSQVNLKFAPKFSSLFSFCQDPSKFNLWISSRMDRQKSLFKFVILTLKCIEQWSEIFKLDPAGKPTQFYEIYSDLCNKSVEFPPNFFLQAYEPIPKRNYKRDLSKVKRFCKEFEYLITTKSLNKVKLLKKVLLSYEKTLDIHLESLKTSGAEPDSYFSDIHTRIKLIVFKFLLWKSSNFTELFDPKVKISVLVPDPQPKSEPLNEILRESVIDDKSSSKSSLSQIEDIQEDLEHKEGLSLMYKQDLSMLQDNYFKLTEEKETYALKNSALEVQALDLLQMISHQKSIIEDFRTENSQILKENSGIVEMNQFLSFKIEELNFVMDKLEKSKMQDRRIVESLENNNELLLLSNKNLKDEIVELRKCKEELLEKVKGYETVTEVEEWVENYERMKHSPNVSIGSGVGRLKSFKTEKIQNEKNTQNGSSFDTFIEFEGYDNEQLYIEYIQKGEGNIFEDEKIRIFAEFEIDRKKCEGNLKIINKLEKKCKFFLEINSFPKEFRQFSIQTGSFKLRSREELKIPVKITVSKLFFDSPLIKLTYVSIFQTKFIKLPVNALIFFHKTEDLSESLEAGSEKRMKMNEDQWISLKKRLYLYGKRLRAIKGDNSKIIFSVSSDFGNFLIQLVFFSNNLKISASGSSQQAAGLVVQNMYTLIYKTVNKIQ